MVAGHVVLQIGICGLISLAAVLTAVIVWRDDHKWRERHATAGPVVEAGPYPLVHHGHHPPPEARSGAGPRGRSSR